MNNNHKMILTITNEKTINEIEKEFELIFPFLKLQFYINNNQPDGKKIKRNIKQNNISIADCRKIFNNHSLTIKPDLTVTELEQKIQNIFGLDIQVLRKSENVWLETSFTDGWTLKEQNHQGEILGKLLLSK
jgi:hypothetical protein